MTGLNYYALHLTRLEHSFDESLINSAIEPFSRAITAINTAIDAARIRRDDAYVDFILDDDLELIETHLGCAFITCQVFLTAVVSRIADLHRYNDSQGNTPLITTGKNKRDILSTDSTVAHGSAHTTMQVIDAFANYFKHR